eukprot:CAMPEP_0172895314 /NCGR_PEP_ID=MMETSP1075-20121228/152846_1 /TAXON_ID=2916 /ORGANISM="Ceratium fusus, Strain PA161109" /LENGTH=55 /DNA_ID=CAMNT_0013750515 /DNA_START=134 /DNA_END=298 /DNA_ORIENTATION=-
MSMPPIPSQLAALRKKPITPSRVPAPPRPAREATPENSLGSPSNTDPAPTLERLS